MTRADQLPESGSITQQVIKLLHESDLVIADLSGLNPNVMYELGIRHAFNKAVIQLIDYDQKIPFDLHGERTIFFDISDPASIEKAKSELKRFSNNAVGSKYISPVARVGYATKLSEGDAFELIGDLTEAVSDLRTEIEVDDTNDIVQELKDNMEETSKNISDFMKLIRSDMVYIKEYIKKSSG